MYNLNSWFFLELASNLQNSSGLLSSAYSRFILWRTFELILLFLGDCEQHRFCIGFCFVSWPRPLHLPPPHSGWKAPAKDEGSVNHFYPRPSQSLAQGCREAAVEEGKKGGWDTSRLFSAFCACSTE